MCIYIYVYYIHIRAHTHTFFIWGVFYNFTNYKFNRTICWFKHIKKTTHLISALWQYMCVKRQRVFSEIVVAEIIVKYPYES